MSWLEVCMSTCLQVATKSLTRQCVYCGMQVPSGQMRCPECREEVARISLRPRPQPEKRGEIRRGLLYMLLAGVIHYFAAGYADPIKIPLPAPVLPLLTQYGTPLLFLGGLGLAFYGVLLRIRH